MSLKGGILLGWASAVIGVSLFVPAYNGFIGNEGTWLLAAWVASVCFAVLALIGGRAETSSEALPGAVAAALLPALTPVAGLAAADSAGRGEPLYLWFGLLAAAAWTVLALVSSSWNRLKWMTPAGLLLSLWTSAVVWFLTYARFD